MSVNETTGMGKIEFDLSDVVVQGTSESIQPMDEAMSRLQLKMNVTAI